MTQHINCAKNVIAKKGSVGKEKATETQDHTAMWPRVGDVYLLKFNGIDSEQSGVRPAVIISNNLGNSKSPNVIALPMTTSLKKPWLPTHVLIKACDSELQYDSMVLCENPTCVSKKRLMKYITTLSSEQMEDIAVSYLLATGIVACISENNLIAARNTAVSLSAY